MSTFKKSTIRIVKAGEVIRAASNGWAIMGERGVACACLAHVEEL
jgi:hypothetical protein